MEQPTSLDKFKDILLGKTKELEKQWQKNPEDFENLFTTLIEDRDIEEFENQLVNCYDVQIQERKEIYYSILGEPEFNKGFHELRTIILFLSIMEQISKKNPDFSEEYSKAKFNDFSFKTENYKENIKNLITSLTKGTKCAAMADSIFQGVQRERICQTLRGKTTEKIMSGAFQEEYSNMKLDLPKYENDPLEYSIQKALISTFERKYQLKGNKNQFQEDIHNIFKVYEKEKEKMVHPNIIAIDETLKKIQGELKDIGKLHDELNRLKSDVCIIDVFKLEKLINESNKQKKQIEDKDAILVIGATGSGKSTTILKFLGNNFVPFQIDFTTKYKPDEYLDKKHASFHTSYEAVSCTSFINSAEIPKQMQKKLKRQKDLDKPLVIVDTPGFEDTRGCQFDISNQIGTIRALYGCNSIRVIIVLPITATLINCGRGAGARQMATIMKKLCPSFDNISSSLKVLINKTTKSTQEEFLKDLQSLLENATKNNHTQEEIEFLEKIQEDCSNDQNFICPVSEKKQKYQKLLKSILETYPIYQDDIRSTFRSAFSRESQNSIEKFYNYMSERIKHFLRRNEYVKAKNCYEKIELLVNLLNVKEEDEQQSPESNESYSSELKVNSSIHSKELDIVNDFIVQETEKYFEELERNLTMIVDSDKNQEYYKEALKNIEKIQEINQSFKDLKSLQGKQQIENMKKSYATKIKQELLSVKEEEDAQKLTKKITEYTTKFGLSEFIKDMVEQKSKTFKITLRNIKDEVDTETFDLEPETIKNVINLAIILDIFKPDSQANKKINDLMDDVDIKFEKCRDVLKRVLSENILERDIKNGKKALDKCKKLIELHIVDVSKKNVELKKVIEEIKKQCVKKIRKIESYSYSTNAEEISDERNINPLIPINNSIKCLLKFDFVSESCHQQYNDMKDSMNRKFEQNISSLTQHFEESNYLSGYSIQNYEEYFKKVKKNIANLIKYSKIIDREEKVLEKIQEFVEIFKNIYIIEKNSIKAFKINWRFFLKKNGDIVCFLKKIKSLKTVILSSRPFIELQNEYKQIIQVLDEKIAQPVKSFSEEISKKIETSEFSYFKTFIDPLDKIMTYHNFIEENTTNFLECPSYHQTWYNFEKILQEKILTPVKEKVSKFIDKSDDLSIENFSTYTEILSLFQARDSLSYELSMKEFQPDKMIEDIRIKLKEYQRKIKANQSQRSIEILDKNLKNVHYLREVEKNLLKHSLDYQKREDSYFEKIQQIIQKQIWDLSKKQEQRIYYLIQNTSNLHSLFKAELERTIPQLERQKNLENDKILLGIFKQLEKLIEKIKNDILLYENQNYSEFQMNEDKQDKQQINSLKRYIVNCKNAIIFYQDMKTLKVEKEERKNSCLNKVSNIFIEERLDQMSLKFSSSEKQFLQSCRQLNLAKIRKNAQIFVEIEKCFDLASKIENIKIQHTIDKQTFIKELIKIRDEKIPESNKWGNFQQNKMPSLSDVITTTVRDFDMKIIKKYSTGIFSLDKYFQSYYESCEKKMKDDLKAKAYLYISKMIDEYTDGDFEDEKSKQIEANIKMLPYQLKKQINNLYLQKKKNYQDGQEERVNKLKADFKNTPSGYKEFIQKAIKYKDNEKKLEKYCKEFEQILNDIVQKQNSCEQMLKTLQQYFDTPFQKYRTFFSEETEIKRIFLEKLNILLQSIQTEQTQSFHILTQARSSYKKDEILYRVSIVFKVYEYISKNSKIDCEKDLKVQIQEEWMEKMKTLKNSLKNQSEVQNFNNAFTSKDNKLKEYLITMQRNTIVIENICLQIKKSSKQLKNFFKGFEQIPTYDNVIQNFEKNITQICTQLLRFEFVTDQRKLQNQKQLTQQFKEKGELKRSIKTKLDTIDEKLLDKKRNIQFQQKINEVQKGLQNKFENLVNDVQKQLQQSFTQYEKDRNRLLNIFLMIGKSLKNSDYLLIEMSLASTSVKNVEELIQKYFSQLREQAQILKKKCEEQYLLFKQEQKSIKNKSRQRIRQLQLNRDLKKEKQSKQFDSLLKQKLKTANTEEEKNKIKEEILTQKDGQIAALQQVTYKQIQSIKNEEKNELMEKEKSIFIIFQKLAKNLILQKKNLVEISNQPSNQTLYETLMQSFEQKDDVFIQTLFESLMKIKDKHSYGQKILKNKIFEGFMDIERQVLTKKQDINYVISKTQIFTEKLSTRHFLNKEELKIHQIFNEFSSQYQRYLKEYYNSPLQNFSSLQNDIKNLGKYLEKNFYFSKGKQKGKKCSLVAKIFALFAILRARPSSNPSASTGKRVIIKFKPHEIQVVSVFLLLGIVQSQKQALADRMAEIGTGEGKSIVLAVVSAYLAVVGFNVRCVCYSQYLSERDEDVFSKLFDQLDISDKIKYGTFNKVCEEILNTGNVDFKSEVAKMLEKQPTNYRILNALARTFGLTNFKKDKNQIQKNKTILLIDEADVFFENNFYGQSYRPAIKLQSEAVNNLLLLIWEKAKNLKKERQMKKIYHEVHQSKEFQEIIRSFRNLEDILENQLHSMIQGAVNFKHQYEFHQKKIVYKENDSICDNISYGYKTIFANIYEYERGNVSKMNLDKVLAIQLVVAEFSYAKLPTFFAHIIGVTGTFRAMPSVKKEILQTQYKIADNFIIPSSFGLNQKKICNYFQVKEEDHHKFIAQRITSIDSMRPIIVFFKNMSSLSDFYRSASFEKINCSSRTFILNEKHDPASRTRNISMATDSSSISFMTKAFGRGTDFQVFDQNIQKIGGVHIIQTFLSEEQAEEVQIKGRTNRQNSPGSVDIIFTQTQLQTLSISQDLSKLSQQNIASILLNAREEKANKQFDGVKALAEESKKRHQKTWKIFEPKQINQKDLLKYVKQINTVPVIGDVCVRTVVAIDGTCSMSYTLKRVIEVVQKTFEKTYSVLDDSRQGILVEMGIVIYRNYNSDSSLLLQTTPFQSDQNKLNQFLSSVSVSGGWGNEAIEVCFQGINKMNNVSQVVLIGDAPGNTDAEVIEKRAMRGEEYWVKNGFPKTTQERQLLELRVKKIPIHTFSLYGAQKQFTQISQTTEGEAHEFPDGKEEPIKLLSNVLGVNIMKIGQQKLKDLEIQNTGLVELFKKRYF